MQLGIPPGSMTDRSTFSSIRQLVTIPANAGFVSLRWWHLYGSQEPVVGDPGASGDRQEVLLLGPNEQVLAVLQRVRRVDNSWQPEAVDLSAFRGQSVYLYFNVFNDGNGLSTWMYIDNVQLEACSGVTPMPTPTRTATLIPSPTTSATTSPTSSPTPTATGTPTWTPTATSSPTPTATGTPTLSPTPTDTGTPTLTPTATMTPTATPTFTPLPTLPADCEDLIVNGGFKVDGNWTLGPLATATGSPVHSAARSMRLGRPPEAGSDGDATYSSVRQLVTIPAGADVVSLRWWHHTGSEEPANAAPGDTADRQEVILLGPEEQVLAILQRVRRNDGVWLEEAADLTAYTGQSVYVYFNVFNDGNGLRTWMHLDDVRLHVCPSGP